MTGSSFNRLTLYSVMCRANWRVFEQQGASEVDVGIAREDARHFAMSLDLAVEALNRPGPGSENPADTETENGIIGNRDAVHIRP
jgi:hypothetical protein